MTAPALDIAAFEQAVSLSRTAESTEDRVAARQRASAIAEAAGLSYIEASAQARAARRTWGAPVQPMPYPPAEEPAVPLSPHQVEEAKRIWGTPAPTVSRHTPSASEIESLKAEIQARDRKLAEVIEARDALAAEVKRLTLSLSRMGKTPQRRRVVLDLLSNPETADLSDRDLARRAGVSPQTVNTWRHRMRQDKAA